MASEPGAARAAGSERVGNVVYLWPTSPISPVLEHSRLAGADRLVLCVLAFAIAAREPLDVESIARMARLSQRRTAAGIRAAELAGELERTAAGYRLTFPTAGAIAA